jgi:membrane protein
MLLRTFLGWNKFQQLYHREIWKPAYLRDTSLRGRCYAVLRVLSITLTGLFETRATSRAAALSFSTLLGLAPLIGIAVLVASFAIGTRNTDALTERLDDAIRLVAPQIAHYEDTPTLANTTGTATPVVQSPSKKVKLTANPELINFINHSIAATRSGAGGWVSTLSLLAIVIMLFTSVEQTFNEIWGVRSGRSWLVRIVSYWSILTLGSVLFFGAMSALSAATFLHYFRENLHQLPFGQQLAPAANFLMQGLSIAVVVLVLTLFYRFIPNTHVYWRAALIGALVVTFLLILNNVLAFSYFRRVDLTRSLFGSLALLPVLMLGLYVFWLFVLVGGQISYAVQNVHFRNSQAAWSTLSEFTRERLTLVVLLAIARRFQACLPPCTISELSRTIRVPTQLLNESLNRLIDMKLVSPVPPALKSATADYLYQPARPLQHITLGQFKHSFENFGDDPTNEGIGKLDPIIERYQGALTQVEHSELYQIPLDELFKRFALESEAPGSAHLRLLPRSDESA